MLSQITYNFLGFDIIISPDGTVAKKSKNNANSIYLLPDDCIFKSNLDLKFEDIVITQKNRILKGKYNKKDGEFEGIAISPSNTIKKGKDNKKSEFDAIIIQNNDTIRKG